MTTEKQTPRAALGARLVELKQIKARALGELSDAQEGYNLAVAREEECAKLLSILDASEAPKPKVGRPKGSRGKRAAKPVQDRLPMPTTGAGGAET